MRTTVAGTCVSCSQDVLALLEDHRDRCPIARRDGRASDLSIIEDCSHDNPLYDARLCHCSRKARQLLDDGMCSDCYRPCWHVRRRGDAPVETICALCRSSFLPHDLAKSAGMRWCYFCRKPRWTEEFRHRWLSRTVDNAIQKPTIRRPRTDIAMIIIPAMAVALRFGPKALRAGQWFWPW